MKAKKLLSAVLVAVMVVALFSITTFASTSPEIVADCTACSAGNPHIITTTSELSKIREHKNTTTNAIDGYFKLGNDIVFKPEEFAEGGEFYRDGEGWLSIGHNNAGGTYGSQNGIYFNGSFDGNGKTISGITTTHSSNHKRYNGLFAMVGGEAHIFNVTLADFNIKADVVGAVAGMVNSEKAVVENITIKNFNLETIGDTSNASGLAVGKLQGGTVRDIVIDGCHFNSNAWNPGYIVGLIQNSTLENVTVTNTHMFSWTKNGLLAATIKNGAKINNISITDSVFEQGHSDSFSYIAHTYDITDFENSWIKNVNIDVEIKGEYGFYSGNKQLFPGSRTDIITMENVKLNVSYDIKNPTSNLTENGSVSMRVENDIIYVIESTVSAGVPGTDGSQAVAFVNGLDFDDDIVFEEGKLAEPKRPGYAFAGWYTDSALTTELTGAPVAGSAYYAKWDNQPIAQIGDIAYTDLADAFAAANEGDVITLISDLDLSDWTSVDVKKAITLDGNGHTILNLSAPLVNNASADLEIKNLTISGANINVKSAAGADNDTASAALVQWANGGTLTITNVTVKDSTIKGDGYVAAYVGFVDSTSAGVVVNGGSIENVTLIAGGTVGAVVGHTYADVTVNDIGVSGNSLTSNSDGGTRPDKVGLVVGRLSADTVSVSATVDGTNAVYPAGDGNAHRVIGSVPGGTAVLTGGIYPTDPTVTANGTVSVQEGFKVEQNANGSYGVMDAFREFVVTTDKDSYAFGETVTVTVTLNGKNLAGAEWTLVYDSTLFELVSGEINGNKYVTGTELFAESETLATYTFKVIGKAVENQELKASFTVTDTKAQTRIEAVENMVYVSSVTPKEVTLTPPSYLVEVDLSGETTADFVAGTKLVIVYTNSDAVGYTFGGQIMFDVSAKYTKEGYTKAFALVVDALSEGTLEAYAANVVTTYGAYAPEYVLGGSDCDLNGSGDVELGDVIVVYGVYNGYAPYFQNNMDAVLKADINGDGRVDAQDTAAVVEEYNK